MTAADDPILEDGPIAEAVRLEHPDLRLVSVVVDATPGKSSPGLQERLRLLSTRWSGPKAVALRTQPIPHAYRVFYRHIGMEPDHAGTRVAAEEVAVRRLMEGGFTSHDRISDAVLIAIVETGVPLFAVDDDALTGPIGVRAAIAGERLGEHPHAHEVPAGRLVVADDRGLVAPLFGEVVAERRPARGTRRIRVFAVGVRGVPSVFVEEALWGCAEALDSG